MTTIVVYATDTGHVLGALAPSGPAAAAPDVAMLVGDALPVWAGLANGQTVPLAFPASRLGSAVVTDQPDALVVPLAFGVRRGSDGKPGPELDELKPATAGSRPLAPPPEGVTVTVAPNVVTVALPMAADADLPVLVVVGSASGTQQPQHSTIRQGSTSTNITITVGAGPHAVLALAGGWRGVVEATG
jgi:hypothetical protein